MLQAPHFWTFSRANLSSKLRRGRHLAGAQFRHERVMIVVIGMEIGKYRWGYGFGRTERLNFIKRVMLTTPRTILRTDRRTDRRTLKKKISIPACSRKNSLLEA